MRGVASSTHCGRKPSRKVLSEKNDEYCALCSSAAAAVAIGQLQLQLSHYSLVALQAFCFPKCDFWGASRGPQKFSRLAIARHIFRPPHKLCYNSTTASYYTWVKTIQQDLKSNNASMLIAIDVAQNRPL